MASAALVKMRDALKSRGASLSKVNSALKGTEGVAGVAKATGVGAATGLITGVTEKKFGRIHEKVPNSLIGVAVCALGASMTKGDLSRGFSAAASGFAAVTVDDWIEGMDDDKEETKEGE